MPRRIVFIVLAGLVVLLLSTTTCWADTYLFSNDHLNSYALPIKAYVDGNEAGYWGYWNYGSHNLNGNGHMLWDVNSTAMTTAFLELHTQLNQPVQFADTISYQLGFGNILKIPFTFHLQAYTAGSSVQRGPFSIGPNLQFNMAGQGPSKEDIVMNVAGYVDMKGEQFLFDFDANTEWTNTDVCIGEFDDSGYPQQLGLRLNVDRRFAWGGGTYYRILQTSVEGHLVEFYANPHYMEGNGWAGQLIPEPASLLALVSGLIGIGGVCLRRRKR